MGQYSDVVRTINDTISGATTQIRDAFDLAPPSGNAPHITHLTFFHEFVTANASNTDPIGDIGNAISRLKLQVGGRVIMDYNSPLSSLDPDSAQLSALGMLARKTGGQAWLYPYVDGTDATVYSFIRIPVGLAFPSGNQRVNLEINYGAIDAAATAWLNNGSSSVSSSKLSIIADYGVATNAVVYASSTQFDHTQNATQTVTISGNSNLGYMLGVMAANDTAADEYGTDGIRVRNGGFAQIPLQYMHLINGDLVRGYPLANVAGDDKSQTYATASKGLLFIPTFKLNPGADLQIDVQSSETTTRYYFPVFCNPINSKDSPAPNQTVQKVSSTVKDTYSDAI
jgi:hypothetical protein